MTTFREALKARIAAATKAQRAATTKSFAGNMQYLAAEQLIIRDVPALCTDLELLLAQLERAEAALAEIDHGGWARHAAEALAALRAVLDAEEK